MQGVDLLEKKNPPPSSRVTNLAPNNRTQNRSNNDNHPNPGNKSPVPLRWDNLDHNNSAEGETPPCPSTLDSAKGDSARLLGYAFIGSKCQPKDVQLLHGLRSGTAAGEYGENDNAYYKDEFSAVDVA